MDCEVKIMQTPNGVKFPKKEHDGDAGFDVFSHFDHDIVLGFGEQWTFPLGFALEIPWGWVALIQAKSGMAKSNGLFTIGNVIDCNYRGEVHATLCCFGQKPVKVEFLQKVAQMIIAPCYTSKRYEVVDRLTDTNRGAGGFGSTGLR